MQPWGWRCSEQGIIIPCSERARSPTHPPRPSFFHMMQSSKRSRKRSTPGAGSAHQRRCLVDELPEEVIVLVAAQLLIYRQSSRHVSRLRSACTQLREQLDPLWTDVLRMRFVRSLCREVVLHRGYQTVSHSAAGFNNAWAACHLLPCIGKSSWRVRVEATMQQGAVYVGVCNSSGTHAWGLALAHGHMRRWSRDPASGRVRGAPPPPGYPDGHRTHVLYDHLGVAYGFKGTCTVGLTLECLLDADAGALSFRVVATGEPAHRHCELLSPLPSQCGPMHLGVQGFPAGEPLRPWVRTMDPPETVSIHLAA